MVLWPVVLWWSYGAHSGAHVTHHPIERPHGNPTRCKVRAARQAKPLEGNALRRLFRMESLRQKPLRVVTMDGDGGGVVRTVGGEVVVR